MDTRRLASLLTVTLLACGDSGSGGAGGQHAGGAGVSPAGGAGGMATGGAGGVAAGAGGDGGFMPVGGTGGDPLGGKGGDPAGGGGNSSVGGGNAGGAGGLGGAGGDGGAGPVLLCVPNALYGCPYSGPPQTLNVGLCVPGLKTCAPDGLSFGACTGEVVPAVEDCSTPELESCAPNTCSQWGLRWPLGGSGNVHVGARAGRVAVSVANVPDQVPFALGLGASIPAGVIPFPTDDIGVIAVATATGAPEWGALIESTGALSAPPLATNGAAKVDSVGRVVIGGKYSSNLAVNGATMLFGGALAWTDGYVVQLDADGSATWAHNFGTTDWDDAGPDGIDTFADLVIDASDNVWVAGLINYDCVGPAANSSQNYWYELLSPTTGQQALLRSTFQTCMEPPVAYDIAAIAVNQLDHLVAVGTRPFDNCGAAWGPSSHLATIGPSCGPAPSVAAGATDVEIDDAENIYVLGATLEKRQGGTLLWSISPPHSGKLALGPAGDLYLFGNVASGIAVTRFDSDGAVVETRVFASPGAAAHDIGIDESGDVYIAGRVSAPIDFGIGSMPGSAGDVFVAKLPP